MSKILKAEEVFSSLAIPMMKLVGLKTVEMAKEGRFSTFIIDTYSPQVIKFLYFVIICLIFFFDRDNLMIMSG